MPIQSDPNNLLNDTINQLTIDVEFSSYVTTGRTWNTKNSAVHFNRLYIPEDGCGVIIGGGETVTMVPGMVYLIPAGLHVDYHCPDHLKKYFFHVNLLKPDQYDLFLGLNKIGQLPFPQEQLQQLRTHYYGTSYADVLAVKLQLLQILLDFQTAYGLSMQPIPHYSEPVIRTIAYIRENLSAKLNMDELAKQCYISRSFLTKLFRREIGVPLGQYITDQLFTEAQRRLNHTDASIGEISHSLGFSDQCYFSRRFKQICGQTPLQYRRYHRP